MKKTYRYIKRDFKRQLQWQKFMKVFRCHKNGITKIELYNLMGWGM